MKKIYIILTVVLCFVILIGCANVKKTYNNTPLNKENGVIKKILQAANAETDDKSVVVFTSWFENDTIKIFNGKEMVYNNVVKTSPDTGLSTFKGVSNSEDVRIQVLSSKPYEIELNHSDIKKYKFVYIKRDAWKRNKYSLEYSNEWKKFM